jgi:signal transduction histidine kinase
LEDAPVAPIRRYVELWVALGGITVLVVSIQDLPAAIYEPHLSSAVGAVSGVIGLALLQLGVRRFRLLRRPLDLHAGLAFGVLAMASLFAVFASTPTINGQMPLEFSAMLFLLAPATAAVLFLTGLRATSAPANRPASPMLVYLAGVVTIAVALLVGSRDELPKLFDPAARDALRSGMTISTPLPGQAPGLILANATIATALGFAAIGYTRAGRRLADPFVGSLAAVLTLLFFGQAHAMLVPSVASDYVTTGDAFRLVGYGLLMSSLVWRTVTELGERKARSERLRLSRDLHDGLAQQLAFLRLRLGRAAEEAPGTAGRAQHLAVAQRLVEAASLETRQAISALRAERVSWDALDKALTTFAENFSQDHAVDVRVWAEPSTASVDGVLEAELLRILHEACSNAVRHGRAGRIVADVSVVHRALRLVIHDDGTGFEATKPQPGLGLRSIAERVQWRGGELLIKSAPGQGTSIRVSLPLISETGR